MYRTCSPTFASNPTTGKDSYSLDQQRSRSRNRIQCPSRETSPLAKSSDPVVFFGNLSYTHNLPPTTRSPSNDPDQSRCDNGRLSTPGDASASSSDQSSRSIRDVSMTVGWDQRFTREPS